MEPTIVSKLDATTSALIKLFEENFNKNLHHHTTTAGVQPGGRPPPVRPLPGPSNRQWTVLAMARESLVPVVVTRCYRSHVVEPVYSMYLLVGTFR